MPSEDQGPGAEQEMLLFDTAVMLCLTDKGRVLVLNPAMSSKVQILRVPTENDAERMAYQALQDFQSLRIVKMLADVLQEQRNNASKSREGVTENLGVSQEQEEPRYREGQDEDEA